MSEPRTAAGRELVRAIAGLSLGGDGFDGLEDVPATVLRVEAEARADALREVAERVASLGYPLFLPRRESPTWDQHAHPGTVERAAVLALLQAEPTPREVNP